MNDVERDRPEISDDMQEGEPEGCGTDWHEHCPQLPPTNEDADLGSALRRIYHETIQEDIPDEMLDLLRRLT